MTPIPGVVAPVSARYAAPNPAGNYLAYYANLRDHLTQGTDLLVPPEQVHRVMQLLALGEQSAQQGRWMPIEM